MKYLLLLVLMIPEAGASEILTGINDSYQAAAGGWREVIFPHAQRLFFILATLQLVWSALRWLLSGEGAERIMVSLFFLMMSLGLFYAILLNAHVWIPALLASFMTIGSEAAGVAVLDPSSVVDLGIQIAMAVPRESSVMGVLSDPSGSLLSITVSVVTAVAFAVIAGQLLITLIESYIVISGGILMLGFAGSRWTAPFAEKFLGYAVSVGVKLFMLYLIVGIGVTMASTWTPMIEEAGLTNLGPYYEVLISALIFSFLAWSIPSTAGSLVSGAVSMTLGGAAGAAMLTGAGMSGGGAAAAGMLGKSMQTLNRTMQTMNAATKHGSAIANATGSRGAGLKAGAGSLLQEAGRAASRKLTGGYNPHAAAIGRRTAAFREQSAANKRSRASQMASHLPRDQGDGGSAEVKLNVED